MTRVIRERYFNLAPPLPLFEIVDVDVESRTAGRLSEVDQPNIARFLGFSLTGFNGRPRFVFFIDISIDPFLDLILLRKEEIGTLFF